jgi:ATP-binding cassette subfamily B protein
MMHQTMMSFRHSSDALRDKKLERTILRRVLRLCRPYRALLVWFLITVVLSALAGAAPALLFKALLDRAFPHHDQGLVTEIAIAAVALAVATAFLALAQRFCSAKIGEGLIYDLRVKLFDHVQALPVAFFTRTQTGALMSRMNNDVIGAQQAVTGTLGTVISNLITLVVTLAIMFSLEWRLTLLTLVVLPLFIIPARRIGRRLQVVTRESMQLNASMNTTISERFNVSGAMLVKLFGHTQQEHDTFDARAARVRDIGVETAMYGQVLFVALGLVAAVGTAVVYWLGGKFVIDHVISVGTVGAFVIFVAQIYAPLTQLTNARVSVMTALVSFDRVFEVIDFPPYIVDRPGAVDLLNPKGAIEFDHVWFRHPPAAAVGISSLEDGAPSHDGESAWILKDMSFSVAPGEFVALVGPSGAGKTTTALLVPRIHEATEGVVRVDGQAVGDLTLESLHRAVGMVMQDPHLFHESIGDNLRYAKPEATDDELWNALRVARIDTLVRSLPDGLATIVGERGYRMSGGEKQRLAIARLMLKDPAIVLLDEATSHLDSESEVAIQHALADALTGRTALVIAHRLSTIVAADRILVIDDGRIVQQGSHDALLESGGLYADLWRAQTDRELTDPV